MTRRFPITSSARRRGLAALALTGTLGLTTACGGTDLTAKDPAAPASAASTASTASLSRTTQNISLAEPAEGATVSGRFTASGKANSFESNVPWEIHDASDAKVLSGFTTAQGSAGRLSPWKTTVDVSKLTPGRYTFIATTDDESDGEGAGPDKVGATINIQ